MTRCPQCQIPVSRLGVHRRSQTQFGLKTYCRHIKAQWGDTFVDEVDPVLVQQWLDSLEFAPKTKSQIKNAFHLLFYYARWWKLASENPIDLVRRSCERLKDPRVLTPGQFKGLLAELKQPYRAMVIVAACTGLRACEVMGLKWADLDRDALSLFVQRSVVAGREGDTKTKASKKFVPIGAAVATE